MADVIQIRRDTAANWTSVNPVLHQGEKGIESDTGREKTGDGVTAWNNLGYSIWTTRRQEYTSNILIAGGDIRNACVQIYGTESGTVLATIRDSGSLSAYCVCIIHLNYNVGGFFTVLSRNILNVTFVNSIGSLAITGSTGDVSITCKPLTGTY